MLSTTQLSALRDIIKILEVPHAAQEALSHEQTPTLSMALPAFEYMLIAWRRLKVQYPQLEHAIQAGLDKIEVYVKKARQNKVYALAMSELASRPISPSILIALISAQPAAEA